jgi:hypothetical protein
MDRHGLCLILSEGFRYLRGVELRLFLNCDAFFRNKQVFALVWTTTRVAVRLPDPAKYAELMAFKGAEPWRLNTIDDQLMPNWVLLPVSFHEDYFLLQHWAHVAWQQAGIATYNSTIEQQAHDAMQASLQANRDLAAKRANNRAPKERAAKRASAKPATKKPATKTPRK